MNSTQKIWRLSWAGADVVIYSNSFFLNSSGELFSDKKNSSKS